MISINMSYFAFVAVILGAGALVMTQFTKLGWLDKCAQVLIWAATAAMTGSLVFRSMDTGHLPLNSVYEFTLSFAWMIMVFAILVMLKMKQPAVAAIVLPLSAVLLLISFKMDNGVRPLMPALRSSWRPVHVITAIVSYGAFAVAFGMGLLYLLKYPKSRELTLTDEQRKQSVRLEQNTYNTIIGGFVFLTLLIITGAFWAEEAWGTWWSWDPKETWGLITWLIYAAYLHLRRKSAGRGRRGSWLAVLGFGCVLFTLLGVSYLMPGLHSYG